jgi:hypothetical protein
MSRIGRSARSVGIGKVAIAAGLLLIPSCFAVTTQSLWIDEASSCWFADHSRNFNPAEYSFLMALPQMPLFHMLLIVWVRVFGDSERALRSINLPFAGLFLGSIVSLFARSRARFWWLLPIPFAVFPLLIYYVNECRPYTALLALSAAAGAALVAFLDSETHAPAYWCSFFCLAAFSMHLLGIIAPFILVCFVLLLKEIRSRLFQQWRSWIIPAALSLPGYLVLLFYYAHARGQGIPHGHEVATPGIPGDQASSWNNVGFFLYETLGFDGLGPARNALRVQGSLAMFTPFLGWLLLGLLACGVLGYLFPGVRRDAEQGRKAWALMAACTIGLAGLFAVARVSQFGFFGRHGMVIVGLMCCAIVLVLTSERVALRARIAVVVVLTAAWGASSARLLLLYPYGKDDGRSALGAAKATGLPILWNAGSLDAAYYGAYDTQGSQVNLFGRPTLHPTEHWQRITPVQLLLGTAQSDVDKVSGQFGGRQVVFVSGKADTFDPKGVWGENLAAWHPTLRNRFNGFDVWIVTVPKAVGANGLASNR